MKKKNQTVLTTEEKILTPEEIEAIEREREIIDRSAPYHNGDLLLSARDVKVSFNLRGSELTAIRGASLDVYEGETLAIVGESGSGKSVFTKTFLGMLDKNGTIGGGEPEYQAIRHARENPGFSIQEYTLNRAAANGLDMICGGTIKVTFIPVD